MFSEPHQFISKPQPRLLGSLSSLLLCIRSDFQLLQCAQAYSTRRIYTLQMKMVFFCFLFRISTNSRLWRPNLRWLFDCYPPPYEKVFKVCHAKKVQKPIYALSIATNTWPRSIGFLQVLNPHDLVFWKTISLGWTSFKLCIHFGIPRLGLGSFSQNFSFQAAQIWMCFLFLEHEVLPHITRLAVEFTLYIQNQT